MKIHPNAMKSRIRGFLVASSWALIYAAKIHIRRLDMRRHILILAVLFFTTITITTNAKESSLDFRTTDFITELSQIEPKNPIIAHLAKQSSGTITKSGDDAKLRPDFVGVQAGVEQLIGIMLNDGRIKKSVGIIHAPTPPTPLCTEGELSAGLVHSSIANDKKRAQTVLERPTILRNYLEAGGKLFAAFPKNGRSKRTPEQLSIYDRLISDYSPNLKEAILNMDRMDASMIGATYFFQMADNSWNVFSIKSTQANDPKDKSEWRIWLGSASDPQIAQRSMEIDEYLKPLCKIRLVPRQISHLIKNIN